ncbi:hypothetical protein MWN33_13400 [Starkeya koreensis]|uniref:Uncharacterized protein n=1 Tax=Ancylobacter koreensis TaxID=266121 RepID=A0ABT0DPI6_9HYPH|nr:hypothetical protein [Ancylobacter koreensis]MCK0209027.1 hypothetical protein [Ancylobacter koreensis]
MTSKPRIRAFLPGGFYGLAPRLPAPHRAGEAPQVFRQFGRTLDRTFGRLERTAATRRAGSGGDGA